MRKRELDAELARARKSTAELELILGTARASAKDNLVTLVRARVPADHKGLPALEKRILAAADFASAKAIADTILEAFPEAPEDASRARGADGRQSSDKPAGGTPDNGPEPEDLKLFDDGFKQEYRRLRKTDKAAADYWIAAGRNRLERDKAQGRA